MMKNTARDARLALCLCVALLLAACGGSGSHADSTPADDKPADGGNAGAQVVPLAPLRSMLSASDLDDAAAASYAALENLAEIAEGIGVAAADFPDALALPVAPDFQLLAGVPQKFDCERGGSITFSGAMANRNQLSKGDEVSVSIDNCQRADDERTRIHGGMRLSVREMNGVPGAASVWSGAIAVRYDNLVTTSDEGMESLDGDIEVNVSQSAADHQALAAVGKALRINRQAAGKAALELALNDYRADIRKAGDDLAFGGDFSLRVARPDAAALLVGVATIQPFAIRFEDAMPVTPADGAPPGAGIARVDVFPSSGQLAIAGAASSATLAAEKSGDQPPAFIARLTLQIMRSDGSYSASRTLPWKELTGAL